MSPSKCFISMPICSDELKIAAIDRSPDFFAQFPTYPAPAIQRGRGADVVFQPDAGDVVVHADYGLGRFARLETIQIDGRMRDCLLLAYHGGDKLYVPIEEFNRVSKYAGKDATPRLTTWAARPGKKLKNKTKKAVADMAAELIKLYAERRWRRVTVRGRYRVQRQLEASFMYEETPDQLKAIYDVKRDMEGANPGDRLVCGDVGLRQNRSGGAGGIQGGHQSQAGGSPGADDYSGAAALCDVFVAPEGIPRQDRDTVPVQKRAEQKVVVEHWPREGRYRHRHASAIVQGRALCRSGMWWSTRSNVSASRTRKSCGCSGRTSTPSPSPRRHPRTLQLSMMGARHDPDRNLAARPAADPYRDRGIQPQTIAEAVLKEIDRTGRYILSTTEFRRSRPSIAISRSICPRWKSASPTGRCTSGNSKASCWPFWPDGIKCCCARPLSNRGWTSRASIPSSSSRDKFGLAQLYQLRGRVGTVASARLCLSHDAAVSAANEDARNVCAP